ncbi:shikimate dehydrogenase [Kroppenstedtia pulmonis]|uniref:Shikimate dehydrogenase (NADP(+)) n=1 Tax=Kroppenstedtia pulmonis TaxID=1380685 RepID=A0A7D3XJT1_9BACL|nr:shikimate dehydrogenase [Kroppenstedtia pulmonis]QKG84999.1 shikimate dehydrogenase [Kroppenstedtia pulmonis]
MRIDSKTQKVGLLGHPVIHSKSPEMMNQAFQSLNLPFVYMAYDVEPDQLGQAVNGMRALGFRGWNVTIPHKVAIMKWLDEVEESAREIGAVNTVIRQGKKLIGTNTDGEGYMRSLLQETRLDLAGCNILILGAGGAARAVGYTLAKAGAEGIFITNRTAVKGKELAERLSRWCPARFVEGEHVKDVIRNTDLLIQTTSVGMSPDVDGIPLDPDWLHGEMVVSDLVYHPRETRLLREAKARGAKVHSGMGMLVYQAALAFEKWTGTVAPVDMMHKTLGKSLNPVVGTESEGKG